MSYRQYGEKDSPFNLKSGIPNASVVMEHDNNRTIHIQHSPPPYSHIHVQIVLCPLIVPVLIVDLGVDQKDVLLLV